MGAIDALRGQRVYLDSNIVIYILERPEEHEKAIDPLLDVIIRNGCECVTAELTTTEVLRGAAKIGGKMAVERCLQFFESGDVVELRATSRDAFYKAGLFRARSNTSTPDAIHLMTAIEHGCGVFLTNDKRIPATDGIKVMQLSELEVC
jgi:predicted nucleic acid-binding protein